MKHIELIIAEIRHGEGDDKTCTCNSSTLNETFAELVESIGLIPTRVALSLATGEVFPREMRADGEILNRTCRQISRSRLSKILEEMVKESLTIDAKQ